MGKKEPKETKGKAEIGKKPVSKKKKLIITVACVGVIGAAAIGFSMNNKSEAATETVYKETTATKGNLTVGITESGNTVLGTETVDYDIESVTSSSSSTSGSSSSQAGGMGTTGTSTSSSSGSTSTMPSLEVEELYVAASDSVTEGDAILKVTDASYTAVKTYLEQAVTSAKLSLKEAEINRTLTKTTAENSYKSNSSQAEIAQEAYNNTIKKLANAVTNAKKELTDTKDSIASYKTAINNDTYYSDYKIATLKKAVTSKQSTVDSLTEKIAKLEAAGVTATTAPAADSQTGDSSADKTSTSDNASKLATYQTQLATAKQELSAAEQAYEQAYEKYETAVAQAKSDLAKLESQLSSLQLSYDEAVTNQKKGKLEAQATLDEALVTANNASTLYDIDLDGIDEEVTSATETLASAEEQLANFNALVVDGKIVANCTGMVTELGYAVGDSISSSTSIATIADASEVTITVSVDQEDIASIAVNDTVNVDFTAYTGVTYQGVVSSISTTASSDNSSTVTYPVVVTLTGDVSSIYSGMSADVTFVTKEMEDVLYVSNKTIINEGTKSYVKVKASDGTITKVEVETGFSDGNNVEITSGISEGETVLIESQVKSN